VIVGAPAELITMSRTFKTLPVVFVALTMILYVPFVVGTPEINPSAEKLKPGGRLPLEIHHVIGVAPFALSC